MIKIWVISRSRILVGGIIAVAVFYLLLLHKNLPVQLQQVNDSKMSTGKENHMDLNEFTKYIYWKDSMDDSIMELTNKIAELKLNKNRHTADIVRECEQMMYDTENVYLELQSQAYPEEIDIYRKDLLMLLNLEAIRLDGLRRGLIAVEKEENYTPFFKYYEDNSSEFQRMNQEFTVKYNKFLNED